MVILMLTEFPAESAAEMGKRFIEEPSLPNFIKRKGPYINSEKGEGIQGTNVYEFSNTRMAEAFEFISSIAVTYLDVPGYSYSIKVCLEAQEALKMIGLA